MNNHRKQILYQKTDYNHSKISMFQNIFVCCKCKKNNTIIVEPKIFSQNCLFCGCPNYVKREKSIY
jgi:hypothetical protein